MPMAIPDAFRKANAAQIDWLLEKDDPSVRLFALKNLLGAGDDDAELKKARASVMKSAPVAAILEAQGTDGAWGDPSKFYTDKYGGSVWQLLVLAELGADGKDSRLRSGCEFVLANSQDRESGGFSVAASAKSGGGRHGEVIPCLTGNMVYSLVSLGYGDDPRLAAALDWICRYQRADDGDGAASGWPYDRMVGCFGAHSCFMGVAKSLKALAATRPGDRGKSEKAAIARLVDFVLAHHVHLKSRDLSKVSKPGWLKFGFPLMYQTDALELLFILSQLGVSDSRCEEALSALEDRRCADGRWKMENSFNGKMLVDIEAKGASSKWITARALCALGRMRSG
jgi:hypothetical protein